MTLYRSTRGGAAAVSFSDAIVRGLAPDGGLYIPIDWPGVDPTAIANQPLSASAAAALHPFFQDDALAAYLGAICAEAFNFPAPLVSVAPRLSVLELFHGPTAAFKDFGARFLAACLARARASEARPQTARALCILVATSGDTGGAVAAAFHNQPGAEVIVLYPKGRVSPLQEHQLTCWGGNVRAFAVRGSFDDCQSMVKAAFADPALAKTRDLSSANSINLGRLLPQMTYFAARALTLQRTAGEAASFIIPSGNLGHATACLWAKRLGFPIDRVVLAHNANRTMPDFLESGVWSPRPSIATPASAMDVGDPSNGERLRDFYPDFTAMRAALTAVSIESEAIAQRIGADYRRYGRAWCPHTAIAAEAYARLSDADRARGHWVIAATAHPAKFREIVEPAIGAAIGLPPALSAILSRSAKHEDLNATVDALRTVLM